MTSKDGRANEAFDLLKQGRHKEARAILEKIVADDSADAAVLETLGDVREKLGDKTGALDAYSGAVTHLRARGEHKRALGVIELMLIVDESSVHARREAAEIRLDMGDEAAAWRDVVGAVDAALAKNELTAALAMCEAFAEFVPEHAPAVAVCRKLEQIDKREASRVARMLSDALRARGKNEDARVLAALVIELQPSLKDVLHPKIPAEERTDEPWAEKTPEVPVEVAGDDDPTDMDR